MKTYVVTGANRGLGLELVRQLAARGDRVIAGCREPGKAAELRTLVGANVTVHALDVGDGKSVAAFAAALGDSPVDVLINNAGVMGPDDQSFGHTDYDAWQETLNINTFGPLRTLEALAENLAKGKGKLAVTVTSGMGSIADNGSGGYYPYRSSKAAVNMVMKSAAVDLKPRGITVVVINPGWVQTDMGGPSATITPAVSIQGMLSQLDKVTPAQTGTFLDFKGGNFGW